MMPFDAEKTLNLGHESCVDFELIGCEKLMGKFKEILEKKFKIFLKSFEVQCGYQSQKTSRK
jgi:hypothetical protein